MLDGEEPRYLCLLGLLQQIIIDWGFSYRQFFAHGSRIWESEVRAPGWFW